MKSNCRDQPTPFTEGSKVFLTHETAPLAQHDKKLILGNSDNNDGFDCIEICAGAKTTLGRKLQVAKTWQVEFGQRYLYVLGGKRPPRGGEVTVSGVVRGAVDGGIGTGTGVAMEGAASVAAAASAPEIMVLGVATAAATVASLGTAAIISGGCLAYYTYKKRSSRTVYFIRIGTRPFLNPGEKGRFLHRYENSRKTNNAYSIVEPALEYYPGWDNVKEHMRQRTSWRSARRDPRRRP